MFGCVTCVSEVYKGSKFLHLGNKEKEKKLSSVRNGWGASWFCFLAWPLR